MRLAEFLETMKLLENTPVEDVKAMSVDDVKRHALQIAAWATFIHESGYVVQTDSCHILVAADVRDRFPERKYMVSRRHIMDWPRDMPADIRQCGERTLTSYIQLRALLCTPGGLLRPTEELTQLLEEVDLFCLVCTAVGAFLTIQRIEALMHDEFCFYTTPDGVWGCRPVITPEALCLRRVEPSLN